MLRALNSNVTNMTYIQMGKITWKIYFMLFINQLKLVTLNFYVKIQK